MADFTLPELGENIASGDVLRVLVKPGDVLVKDQTVLELETDKATIEVPSSVAGRVTSVGVKTGDKVKVGQVVLSVDDGAGGEKGAAKAGGAGAESGGEKAKTAAKVSDGGHDQADEGEKGPSSSEKSVKSRRDVQQADRDKSGEKEEPEQRATRSAPERLSRAAAGSNVVAISRGARTVAEPATAELPPAPAAPSVRRLARELGVEIEEVGAGPDGRISIEDVKAHAKRTIETARAVSKGGAGATGNLIALPDFSRWGEIDRQPMRAVRKKTAEHLTAAWLTIPHVTQHGLADVTALEELRKKYSKEAEAAGGNLTVTAIAVKVVAAALKVFPQFNASIDLAAEEIIYKKYVNIGVAVDTDRGLLVPVVHDADTKNIIQLAAEIADLSTKARTRKISLEEMQGGCFSISNLGGIGGTYFTPIVNAPEVAILGISRARMEPIYKDGEFVPRLMLPLSLSYDHRAIDGADGMRFLRWVAEALEQPFLLALEG